MPKRWKVAYSGGSTDSTDRGAPADYDATAGAPGPEAGSEELEADTLDVRRGTLVFTEAGVVKYVIANGVYRRVERLPDT